MKTGSTTREAETNRKVLAFDKYPSVNDEECLVGKKLIRTIRGKLFKNKIAERVQSKIQQKQRLQINVYIWTVLLFMHKITLKMIKLQASLFEEAQNNFVFQMAE